MKKNTFLSLVLSLLILLFAGCSGGYLDTPVYDSHVPSTMVFVQGQLISNSATTKSTYKWPDNHSDQGWAVARFSLRADNTAPDYLDHPSDLYYGRPAGKDGKNRGEIYTEYPYGHYNDRNFDYYQKDKYTGYNIGLFRYVFDKKGLQTQKVLKVVPKVEDILADEVDDITAMINEGKTVDKKGRNLQEKLDHVNSLVALGSDYLETHILWYVVKEVAMQHGWHVNGVISNEPVGHPDNIPDNVEIDIHQQEHADWSEIKTSVHIRSDIGAIEINLPLDKDDIVEANDFTVRVWRDYIPSEDYVSVQPVPAVITVKHDDKGATFVISEIDFNVISSYKEAFGDGLTVEISTFTKSNDTAYVWSKIKNSTVVDIEKPTTVTGQITSAYFEDRDVIKVMSPNGKNGSSF